MARASRPWGPYKLRHGRPGHATEVYLFYVAKYEAPSRERLLNAEVFVRSRHFNDRFRSDWEFLAEVPAHGVGKKFVPGPSENGGREGTASAVPLRPDQKGALAPEGLST